MDRKSLAQTSSKIATVSEFMNSPGVVDSNATDSTEKISPSSVGDAEGELVGTIVGITEGNPIGTSVG